MGISTHFYIIFETNLLTGSPVRVAIFCLFQCFAEKVYQTESKRNETFGELFLEQTWSRGLGVEVKKRARRPRGREARLPPWVRPHHRGPLAAPPTYFFLLYILIYPENIREHHETLFPPLQPFVPVRSHLGAFSGAPPEGESITEDFYINTDVWVVYHRPSGP